MPEPFYSKKKKIDCSIFETCSAAHRPSFVVVATRIGGKWAFVQNRETHLYAMPSGYIRKRESDRAAAVRVLYEKTGIAAGCMYLVCSCSCRTFPVAAGHGRCDEYYGSLYYAECFSRAALPDTETDPQVEVVRADGFVPGNADFTLPALQVPLFRKIAAWLCDAQQHGPQSACVFPFEKVCGILPYCRENGVMRFLLIRSRLRRDAAGYFGFPKGHTENGEPERVTAVREATEEIGLTLSPHDGFRYSYSYFLGNIHKSAVYFLAELAPGDPERIRIQEEEVFDWKLLSLAEALDSLNRRGDQAMLREAAAFLETQDT